MITTKIIPCVLCRGESDPFTVNDQYGRSITIFICDGCDRQIAAAEVFGAADLDEVIAEVIEASVVAAEMVASVETVIEEWTDE